MEGRYREIGRTAGASSKEASTENKLWVHFKTCQKQRTFSIAGEKKVKPPNQLKMNHKKDAGAGQGGHLFGMT